MNPDALANRMMREANNRDGLPEIAAGVTLLAASALIGAQVIFPRGSAGFRTASLAFAVVIPALCLAAAPALRWIRGRYLIEKVGYVEHRPAPRWPMILSAAIAIAAMPLLYFIQPLDRWLVSGTGILGGLLLAMCGRQRRFYAAGVLMAVAGLFIGASGATLEQGFATLFAFQGLVTLIPGGIIFARLLRQPA